MTKKLTLLFALLFVIYASLTFGSPVYGRVYRSINDNKLSVQNAIITVYDVNGNVSAFARSNNFGYYQTEVPCCQFYVITIQHRLYDFRLPVRIFNTAFDNGDGFHFDFVVTDRMMPSR